MKKVLVHSGFIIQAVAPQFPDSFTLGAEVKYITPVECINAWKQAGVIKKDDDIMLVTRTNTTRDIRDATHLYPMARDKYVLGKVWKKGERPPIGLRLENTWMMCLKNEALDREGKDRDIHEKDPYIPTTEEVAQRIDEIYQAMVRYREVHVEVPNEWEEEFRDKLTLHSQKKNQWQPYVHARPILEHEQNFEKLLF